MGKRVVKSPKVHLVDTTLLAQLINLDRDQLLSDRSLAGGLLEAFVVTEFLKQLSWSTIDARSYHYRSSNGAEVDLVIERPDGEVIGIEIKSTSLVKSGDCNGLRHLRDALGERFRAGIVIYTGEHTVKLEHRIWALPISALWLA